VSKPLVFIPVQVNPAPSQPGTKLVNPALKPMLILVSPVPFFIIYFAKKYKHLSRNEIKINNKNNNKSFTNVTIYYRTKNTKIYRAETIIGAIKFTDTFMPAHVFLLLFYS
jgi:hypothetical protein